ncbi:hypothetical protein DDE82_002175 [Stemphylium lycopersici]|nr:hypothetical protein TW65_09012 [Stemphylium lycopersici]RAR08559.1 hypothetical protein DDE82_002175 [Stemphylium lycopersici]
MVLDASSAPPAQPVDTVKHQGEDALPQQSVFPFLRLPRELRDQIYNYAFAIQNHRCQRPIERRNLKYFKPSAAAILLITRHDYFLLNRQVAREALEILFKHHTVYLSCGPFVLKTLFEKIEEPNGPGRQWLKWLKKIQLDWETLPNLRNYPPERDEGRSDEYWEYDEVEIDVDYVRGAYYNGHYDEYDHEGEHYDDNLYSPPNMPLYPSFRQPTTAQAPDANDPFGLANHYPFAHPSRDPVHEASAADIATKLDLLVSLEVTPLFSYLASPTFNLSSITLPLAFISRDSFQHRNTSRPGYALPVKIRYWIQVCVHALLMLVSPHTSGTADSTPLEEVRVRYAPTDIWASMEPTDDLRRMVHDGVWFDDPDEGHEVDRPGEGETFRAVWEGMRARIPFEERKKMGRRMGLKAAVEFVPWDGDIDNGRVGDELEVVFTRDIAADR